MHTETFCMHSVLSTKYSADKKWSNELLRTDIKFSLDGSLSRKLDVENEMHLSLIHSSSNLYAQMLDIPQEHDKSVFKSMLLTIKPKKGKSRGEIRHYDEEK